MADSAEADGRPAPGQANLFTLLLHKIQGLLPGRNGAEAEDPTLERLLDEHLGSDRLFTKDERRMLTNLLAFGELRVDDVMVPRADIKALELATPLDDTLAAFAEAGHSRMPLYRDTLDDPVGMIHIKDVMAFIAGARRAEPGAPEPAFALARLKRDVLFVPRSMPALDLLVRMQAGRVHLALVIDEYGGTDGLVSIEDLVEEIVGDIEDEHDVEESPAIVRKPDGTYELNARIDLEELEEELGLKVVPEGSEDDVDTLGGLIAALVGRVPQRGELIRHPDGYEFLILDADLRRIKRLRLTIPEARRVPAAGGASP